MMRMIDKYCTLPLSSSSSSTTQAACIHERNFNLNFPRHIFTLYEPAHSWSTTEMKLLAEQPTIRTYSLYDIQDRINYFEKKTTVDDADTHSKEHVRSDPSSSSSAETLQSILVNTFQQTCLRRESYGTALSRTMMSSSLKASKARSLSSGHLVSDQDPKRSNRYSSSIAKRVRTYSLCNHSTMAITATTSFSEEQSTEPQETISLDYENTYYYPEETTRFDDVLSLTTITSDVERKRNHHRQDASVCSDTTVFQSDTDENSDAVAPMMKHYGDTYDIKLSANTSPDNLDADEEQIIRIRLSLTPPEHEFTGVVHATKCTVIEDDQAQLQAKQSLTSSMQPKHRSHPSIEDDYVRISHPTRTDPWTRMTVDIELPDEDGHDSDHSSQTSEECRYTSDAARNSCASDDLNNTSSTLRQEAISITKVRCKRRKTWIRASSSPTRSVHYHPRKAGTQQYYLSIPLNQADDGTDACHHNASVNSTITTKADRSSLPTSTRVPSTMLLHNHSVNGTGDDEEEKNQHDQTPAYEFLLLNTDPSSSSSTERPREDDSIEKEIQSPASKRSNDCLLSSSLSPVKRLLNESIDSNIEIIQMDEQDCILEIVDGVLTIVPKDKSSSSSVEMTSKKTRDHHHRTLNPTYNNPSQHQQRSSSVASSISSPSLSEPEQAREDISSASSSRLSSKASPRSPAQQIEESADVLDLFSTPILSSMPAKKRSSNLPNGSLSSTGENVSRRKISSSIPRSSSPIHQHPPTPVPTSIKEHQPVPVEHQTRSNKTTVLSELLQAVKKAPASHDDKPLEKSADDYLLPKSEPPPAAKPINKARINEFAALLSSSVHLAPTPPVSTANPKKTTSTIVRPSASSPTRSEDQSFSSIPSVTTDRESFHTVKSIHSEQEATKKHIDARYNEKIDDRGSINVKTANIKAIFEQKISTASRALSQSSDHLSQLTEARQAHSAGQHKKVPISYGSLKRHSVSSQPTTPVPNRSKVQPNSPTMNKYADQHAAAKDVVIEDKQLENGHGPHAGSIVRPRINSFSESVASVSNGSSSESLIAREIREIKEKEEELKRQRQKCGLAEEVSASSKSDPIKSEAVQAAVKNKSFLSNLDFFTSKANGSLNESTSTIPSPRRSIVSSHNLIYDSQGPSSSSSSTSSSTSSQPASTDELKQMTNIVSQELHRFNENGIPILRSSSTNGTMHRSSSNQNILAASQTNNIIQREIEAIRMQEAELRELGRIQRTSDEHSDPRKYQEHVPALPKSQSIHTMSTSNIRRDSENQHALRSQGPMTATGNGFLKPKPNRPSAAVAPAGGRAKVPNLSPSMPVISSTTKPANAAKLSLIDRLELEKRQVQEREQELKQRRHLISVGPSSTNSTVNGDSGNVSQEEHEEDQERYFDKIERLKRTENEKAQAPLMRPTKKFDMSQKWEQMIASRIDD